LFLSVQLMSGLWWAIINEKETVRSKEKLAGEYDEL
jgi:hypothetical protein